MSKRQRPIIAVFASGGGTTFQAVADAIHDGLVDFSIGLLITDQEDARVLDRVAMINKEYSFGIKTIIINKKRYPGGPQDRGQTRAEAAATIAALKEHHIDHLCLMGCLRIIATQVIEAYGWRPEYAARDPENQGIYKVRLTNTHPGIVPATNDTFGVHTQEKVLSLGLRETAHTLLAVTGGVDDGPIIAEHRVAVFPPSLYPSELADTPEKLFARVQRVEKAHLPLDLDAFLKHQERSES